MADAGLRRDAVGLREVLFQSITDMAPGAAIAASIPAGVAFAGGALPLAVVFALIACLFSAWSIGQLARELPSSGSMATYAARGLHPALGFLTAWAYAMVGWLIPPAGAAAARLHGGWHAATRRSRGYPANLWWPWAILGLLIIFAAGYFGVRTSARFGTILGVFEIAVFLIMGILLVFHAGSHNTLSVFTTKYTPSGFHGLSGVDRRLGLQHPGLRRVRGRRAAGRGGPQPAPDDPARGAARHAADRRALRVHHLRGRRRLRAVPVLPASRPAPGAPPGRAWPGRSTACSGSWSSSRSSTPRWPTPTPA